jgi:hypothetical protein
VQQVCTVFCAAVAVASLCNCFNANQCPKHTHMQTHSVSILLQPLDQHFCRRQSLIKALTFLNSRNPIPVAIVRLRRQFAARIRNVRQRNTPAAGYKSTLLLMLLLIPVLHDIVIADHPFRRRQRRIGYGQRPVLEPPKNAFH